MICHNNAKTFLKLATIAINKVKALHYYLCGENNMRSLKASKSKQKKVVGCPQHNAQHFRNHFANAVLIAFSVKEGKMLPHKKNETLFFSLLMLCQSIGRALGNITLWTMG